MLLAALTRRVRGRNLQVAARDIPGLLGREEFHRVMARERARADRNAHTFSLVVFKTSLLGPSALQRVARTLVEQRRLTDDVGWVDPPDLGAVLPDTPAGGARIYADRIHDLLQAMDCDVEDRIFAYQGSSSETSTWSSSPRGPGADSGAGRGSSQRQRTEAPAPPAAAACSATKEDVRADDMREWFLKPMPGWKRLMDIVVSTAMLLILAPVFLGIAAAVKLSSPGPVIFRQKRAGRGGTPFDFYKFRTMVADAEALKERLRACNEAEGPVFKMKRDPRVTAVGRVLRRTSLDELPQIWNVLKGDMSLVGPRPPTMDEIGQYLPWHARRLELTGGITGIWQTSGRHEIGFTDWMRMDVRYAEHRTLGTDLKLLLKTIGAVVNGRGAS
jgi:lipopolysaccharide/colanic/teichoic acid biosynthesis glycosyltransferase